MLKLLQGKFVKKLSEIKVHLSRVLKIIVIVFFVVACADPPGVQVGDDIVVGAVISSDFVSLSTWESDRKSLWVRGVANRGDKLVTMIDADSGEFVGSVVVDSRRRWRYAKSYRDLSEVPCRLSVSSASLNTIVDVAKTPGNCQIVSSAPNSPPNGTIVNPSNNFSIRAGEKVFFSAT